EMKILYFAWLRGKTGTAEELVAPPASVTDVAGLIEWLKQQSPGHAEALADASMVGCAVNQEFAQDDDPVRPGDEIAFFPPVTGG
ncbi:MAG: molybdopterin converting factor subunit 1, partial [Alphaproteobacteria bacterium]